MMRYAGVSHAGQVRDHNEDAFVVGRRLLAVADGVGGEAAGEVASALTAEALDALNKGRPPRHPLDDLRAAIETASREIRRSVVNNPERRGMATTLTALLFVHDEVTIGHVGDSRAYLWREAELTQLTRDDTYVQVLIEQGKLDEAEIKSHPYRSMVTRTVQGQPVEATLRTRSVQSGDRYMLCSDGLPDVVSADDIAAVLGEVTEPQECVDRLVELALSGGAPDNVTVVVADVVGETESRPQRGRLSRLLRRQPRAE